MNDTESSENRKQEKATLVGLYCTTHLTAASQRTFSSFSTFFEVLTNYSARLRC